MTQELRVGTKVMRKNGDLNVGIVTRIVNGAKADVDWPDHRINGRGFHTSRLALKALVVYDEEQEQKRQAALQRHHEQQLAERQEREARDAAVAEARKAMPSDAELNRYFTSSALAPNGREKPYVPLANEDGNAWAILGRAQEAMRRAGWPEAEMSAIQHEAMSGDYRHLLRVVMAYTSQQGDLIETEDW